MQNSILIQEVDEEEARVLRSQVPTSFISKGSLRKGGCLKNEILDGQQLTLKQVLKSCSRAASLYGNSEVLN